MGILLKDKKETLVTLVLERVLRPRNTLCSI